MQLKSKDKITSQTSSSRSNITADQLKNSKNKSVLTLSNSQANSHSRVGENSFVPKQRLVTYKRSPLQNSIAQNSIYVTSHTIAKQAKSDVANPQKMGKVAKVGSGTIKRNNTSKTVSYLAI